MKTGEFFLKKGYASGLSVNSETESCYFSAFKKKMKVGVIGVIEINI